MLLYFCTQMSITLLQIPASKADTIIAMSYIPISSNYLRSPRRDAFASLASLERPPF